MAMFIDDTWPVTIAAQGAVTGASITWRRRGQLFVTVVAKVAVVYDARGMMQMIRPTPLTADDAYGLSTLAPVLPRCDVVLAGAGAAEQQNTAKRVIIARAGTTLLDKQAEAVSDFHACGTPPKRVDETQELADDHDFATHQAAPADQRIDYLQGDETLILEGVDADHPRVEVRFPLVRPRIRLKAGKESAELHMHLDSVGIHIQKRECTLLFRGSSPVRSEEIANTSRAELSLGFRDAPEQPAGALSDLDGTVAIGQQQGKALTSLAHTALVDANVAGGAATPFANLAPPPNKIAMGKTAGPIVPHGLLQTLPFGKKSNPAVTPFETRPPGAPPPADDEVPLSGETIAVTGATGPPSAFATPFGTGPSSVPRPPAAIGSIPGGQSPGSEPAGETPLDAQLKADALAAEAREAEARAREAEAHAAEARAAEARAVEARAAEARAAEAREKEEAAEAARIAEEEATAKRREEAAARFEKEQRDAEARELAKKTEKVEAERKKASARKKSLYGFKKKS